jgi:transposase
MVKMLYYEPTHTLLSQQSNHSTMVVAEEDAQAKTRRDAGQTRVLEVPRSAVPHPGRGGSTGYDPWFRQSQVNKFQQGEDIDVSLASVYRWLGRIQPFRATGNSPSSKIVGEDQFLMVVLLYAYPHASADEISTFIYNNTANVYSREDVSKRLKELHLTKKRASTEAYQAFTPLNKQKVRDFWTQGPPLGVIGLRRAQLIDVDECGFELSKTNRGDGHGFIGLRLRKPGHYTRNTKITVIMGIEAGDPTLPDNVYGSLHHPRR